MKKVIENFIKNEEGLGIEEFLSKLDSIHYSQNVYYWESNECRFGRVTGLTFHIQNEKGKDIPKLEYIIHRDRKNGFSIFLDSVDSSLVYESKEELQEYILELITAA